MKSKISLFPTSNSSQDYLSVDKSTLTALLDIKLRLILSATSKGLPNLLSCVEAGVKQFGDRLFQVSNLNERLADKIEFLH